jgi:acyl-CoA synthetase (AMP-forming)/AMP-acid ligase II
MRLALERFGAIADLTSGKCWRNDELLVAIAARARELTALEVSAQDRVIIAHGQSLEFFADLFGLWSLGATAAIIDASLTEHERATIADFTGAKLALCAPDDMNWPGKTACFHGLPAGAEPAIARSGGLDAPALILFTSGTTGAPKGVVLSFRALLARIALNIAHIGRDALHRSLLTLPTHFGHGLIGNALTPLFAGGDLLIAPKGMTLAASLGPLIDTHRITFMSSVPTLWRMAAKLSQPPKDGSLRRVHVGSAPLSAGLWREIAVFSGADVWNCYGITETANWIGGANGEQSGFIDGYIGEVWGGAAAVRNEEGRISFSGEGEIIVQTPALMSGYLNRPDLTAAALEAGWYRTGDQGLVDEAGRITLKGRIKDEINRAGFKIQPAEIDMLIETHPDVAEACVFAVPDPVAGEIAAAAVKLKPGASVSADALRSYCLSKLRREATPDRWFFVSEIPRTPRGKVSREAVRKALIEDKH